MNKAAQDKCGYICWFLVVLLIIIIFLIIVNDYDIANFTEKRPGMAAWVQAIGSIFAFGIALIVYVDELSKRRKDENLARVKHIVFVKSIILLIEKNSHQRSLNEMEYKARLQMANFSIQSLENEISKMMHARVHQILIEFVSAYRVYVNYLIGVESKLFSGVYVLSEIDDIDKNIVKYRNIFIDGCKDIVEELNKLERVVGD